MVATTTVPPGSGESHALQRAAVSEFTVLHFGHFIQAFKLGSTTIRGFGT